jgi:hypothetical protein
MLHHSWSPPPPRREIKRLGVIATERAAETEKRPGAENISAAN